MYIYARLTSSTSHSRAFAHSRNCVRSAALSRTLREDRPVWRPSSPLWKPERPRSTPDPSAFPRMWSCVACTPLGRRIPDSSRHTDRCCQRRDSRKCRRHCLHCWTWRRRWIWAAAGYCDDALGRCDRCSAWARKHRCHRCHRCRHCCADDVAVALRRVAAAAARCSAVDPLA